MIEIVPAFQSIVHDVLDLPTLTAYISYARKHIHPQLSEEAAEKLVCGYVEMRKRGNFPGSGKKVCAQNPRCFCFVIFIEQNDQCS